MKKLQKTDLTYLDSGYHSKTVHQDQFMSNNFWGNVNTFLKQEANTSPSFNDEACTQFFTDVFACLSPGKLFPIGNWILSFSTLKVSFDLSPPTYQHVTNVIHEMGSAAYPSPLDQISIICFKCCPLL